MSGLPCTREDRPFARWRIGSRRRFSRTRGRNEEQWTQNALGSLPVAMPSILRQLPNPTAQARYGARLREITQPSVCDTRP